MGEHLETTGKHRLHLSYDTAFTWPGGRGETAVFYLPIPPSTGGQKIESFSSSLRGTTETDEGGHRYLTATLRHESSEPERVHWHVDIRGIFQTRQLTEGAAAAGEPIPSPGGYLESTDSIDWDTDAFQGWLDETGLRRRNGETAVETGRRIYDYLHAHGRYSYPPGGGWSAAGACRRLHTDCGGFSLVFTAACRANHIPARMLVGQCFKGRQEADGTVAVSSSRQAHVIAEFFDPAIGWIPEDVASAFLGAPGYPDREFFGRDPGYFFAWHIDTDFHFDTPRKADAHVQWIQNPSLYFSGNADGADDTISHHWTIESLD